MSIATNLESTVEWIVFAIVVLATASLNVVPAVEEIQEVEVSNLSGTITLSTRSSMDVLGLEEFERGALATVNMDVRSVVSQGCEDCASTPQGVQLEGRVNITEVFDDSGKQGRIEANMNIVHLSEFVDEDFVTREWISIDWVAGDESKKWELYISHDPPKWKLDERYQAAFIDGEDGMESRTGPWLLIQTLIDNSVNVHGCLPDSPTCQSNTPPDINLNSAMVSPREPLTIEHVDNWKKIENVSSTEGVPDKLQNIREQLVLGEELLGNNYWCSSDISEVDSAHSWEMSKSNTVTIAPMGIWLDALQISNPTFSFDGDIWSEVEFDDSVCATVLDDNLELRLGILVY